MALTKVYSGGIATVANTAITGVATVTQGGTGANTFAASSAGVMGLVMYNGTNLTTDPAGNVFHVGYSEATHTMYANNISVSANINVASAYNNGFAQPNATVMGLVMYNGTNLTNDPAGNVFHCGYSEATHTMYANNFIAPGLVTVTNYTETMYTSNTGAAFTVNLANGATQNLTANASTIITLPTSAPGKSFTLLINYAGSYTITFTGGTSVKWAGNTVPTATASSGKVDIFNFYQDGVYTYGTVFGQNF